MKETFAKWSISNASDGKRLNSGAEFTNHKNCPQLDNMVSKCPKVAKMWENTQFPISDLKTSWSTN